MKIIETRGCYGISRTWLGPDASWEREENVSALFCIILCKLNLKDQNSSTSFIQRKLNPLVLLYNTYLFTQLVLFTKESILRAKSKATEWAYLWEAAVLSRMARCVFCFFPEGRTEYSTDYLGSRRSCACLHFICFTGRKRRKAWLMKYKEGGRNVIWYGLRNAEKQFKMWGEQAEILSKVL